MNLRGFVETFVLVDYHGVQFVLSRNISGIIALEIRLKSVTIRHAQHEMSSDTECQGQLPFKTVGRNSR